MSRTEAARRAGLASAKSPKRYSPFRDRDEDWKEEIGRKGGLTTAATHDMRTLGRKGGLAKKTKHTKIHRVT